MLRALPGQVRILPGADPGQMRQDDPSDAVGVAHHEQDVQASGLRCRADSHAWVLRVPAHGGSGNQTSQRQPRPVCGPCVFVLVRRFRNKRYVYFELSS